MKRREPRRIAAAVRSVAGQAAPPTTLAQVQSCWEDVAGAAVVAAARPLSEHDGVLTIACESSSWAHELELLSRDLLARLNEAVQEPSTGRLRALRFVMRAG